MDIETKEIKDSSERKIISDIKEFGWSIMHVFDEKGQLPNFSYSVGIYHTFNQPEIVVFGMPNNLTQIVINNVGSTLNEKTLKENTEYKGYINEEVGCVFKRVKPEYYNEHFGFNTWLYDNQEFPVFQLVWPDKTGKYPWDEGFEDSLREDQPILY